MWEFKIEMYNEHPDNKDFYAMGEVQPTQFCAMCKKGFFCRPQPKNSKEPEVRFCSRDCEVDAAEISDVGFQVSDDS